MHNYIIKRILITLPILFLISLISFSLVFITPGDTAQIALQNPSGGADEKTVEAFREQHGLNDPFYVQYIRWLGNALQGNLGKSYMTNSSVTDSILKAFQVTVVLAAVSMAISLIIAIPLGMLAALYKGTFLDDVCRFFSLIGVSMPNFWEAYILMIVFALILKILPSSGYVPNNWKYIILPSVALGTGYAAITMRLMRNSLLDVLNQDYIMSARAKGLSEITVVFRHALKNAFIPVITIAGLNFGYLLNGSVIIETIFAWPGIGNLLVSAILDKDYPVIQGCILFIAVIFLVINFLVDISYTYLNPKIRDNI